MTRDRVLKVALGVSLAVNLAVLGLVGGTIWRHGGPPSSARTPDLRSFGAPYVRALPKESRRAVFQAARSGGPDRRSRHQTYRKMLTVLREDEWSQDTAQDVLAGQGKAAQSFLDKATAAWLAQVSQMSQHERWAYADRLEHLMRKGPRKDKKNKKH